MPSFTLEVYDEHPQGWAVRAADLIHPATSGWRYDGARWWRGAVERVPEGYIPDDLSFGQTVPPVMEPADPFDLMAAIVAAHLTP
jgi:hypothetical protein